MNKKVLLPLALSTLTILLNGCGGESAKINEDPNTGVKGVTNNTSCDVAGDDNCLRFVVDYPIAEGGKKVNLLSKPSMLFGVKKNEKNPEQVGTFLNDFLNGEKANEILGLSRGIPASSAAVKSLTKSGKLTGFMKDGYDYGQKAVKMNETPFYEDGSLTTIYTTEIEAVELGKTDLKTAAKNVFTKTKDQAAKLAKDYKLK